MCSIMGYKGKGITPEEFKECFDRTISRGPQAIVIYDDLNKKFFLKSAEGKTLVYLNRNLLMSHEELRPYDIIQLGNTQLIFVPLCTEKFSWE